MVIPGLSQRQHKGEPRQHTLLRRAGIPLPGLPQRRSLRADLSITGRPRPEVLQVHPLLQADQVQRTAEVQLPVLLLQRVSPQGHIHVPAAVHRVPILGLVPVVHRDRLLQLTQDLVPQAGHQAAVTGAVQVTQGPVPAIRDQAALQVPAGVTPADLQAGRTAADLQADHTAADHQADPVPVVVEADPVPADVKFISVSRLISLNL